MNSDRPAGLNPQAIRHSPASVVNFDTIHAEERAWIQTRRKTAELPAGDPATDAVGLSLSGGGIRSAIFGLGLLQSLQRYGILKHVDYLSTVSGGGYIGSSLTWFMSEHGTFPFGERRKDNSGHAGTVVKWLRSHGSYLSPGAGITGWALAGAVAMGMIVNFLVVIPVLLAIFYFASRPLTFAFQTLGHEPRTVLGLVFYAGLGVLAVFIAFTVGTACAPDLLARPKLEKWLRKQLGRVLKTGVMLTILGLIPFLDYWLTSLLRDWVPSIATLAGGAGAVLGALNGRTQENENKQWRSFLLATGLLLLLYGLCLGGYHLFLGVDNNVPLSVATLTRVWLGLFLIASFVLSHYSDINMVSMHRYYRDRLCAAFIDLPEPTADKSPAPETAAATPPLDKKARKRRQRRLLRDLNRTDAPYHLINTIIQTVGSKDPKLSGRGGDNFIFSPIHCGSECTGYRRLDSYDDNRTMDLATAMAISGAAVDPNTYMTRKTGLRVLMTLLNMRLGYWTSNPRHESPSGLKRTFWLNYVLREATGRLDETGRAIHLSDGGGFENLGIYELIRRRCKFIFVSDASEDSQSAFNDLAKAIEMVRADFGTKIQILVDELAADTVQHRSKSAFTLGKIVYDDEKSDTCGHLIYMNTALTEGLMADLYSYARLNPDFPEQSTVDQFFDERQFEAYRELGYQIGKQVCQGKEWSSPAELIAALESAKKVSVAAG